MRNGDAAQRLDIKILSCPVAAGVPSFRTKITIVCLYVWMNITSTHAISLSFSLSLSPSLPLKKKKKLTWVTWWILMCRGGQLNRVHGSMVARGWGLHCGGGGGLWLLLRLSFVRLLGGQRRNRRGGV